MKKTMIVLIFMCLAPFLAHSVEYRWQNEAGKEMNISSHQGKAVALHFWASWCPPCRKEMPALVAWKKQHPDTTVIIVSLDSDRSGAESFFTKQSINTPLNMGNMRDASRLGVRGLPSTFIIGADGEVKKRHVGDINWADDASSREVLSWF